MSREAKLDFDRFLIEKYQNPNIKNRRFRNRSSSASKIRLQPIEDTVIKQNYKKKFMQDINKDQKDIQITKQDQNEQKSLHSQQSQQEIKQQDQQEPNKDIKITEPEQQIEKINNGIPFKSDKKYLNQEMESLNTIQTQQNPQRRYSINSQNDFKSTISSRQKKQIFNQSRQTQQISNQLFANRLTKKSPNLLEGVLNELKINYQTIKVKYESESHFIDIDQDMEDFEHFKKQLKNYFQAKLPNIFVIQYYDYENDQITITKNSEFKYFLTKQVQTEQDQKLLQNLKQLENIKLQELKKKGDEEKVVDEFSPQKNSQKETQKYVLFISPSSYGKHSIQNELLSSLDFADVQISIIQGDLTQECSDCIVNAANSNLQLGGGVAGAIRQKGGNSIQNECDIIISQVQNVKTGQAVMTGAGLLQTKHIIHAVGPVWEDGQENKMIWQLINCIKCSLTLATQKKLKSISFPAISSGIFGYPKELCAKVFFIAIKGFLAYDYQNLQDKTLQEIRLCNIDDQTCQIFQKHLNQFKNTYTDRLIPIIDYKPDPIIKINPQIIVFQWYFNELSIIKLQEIFSEFGQIRNIEITKTNQQYLGCIEYENRQSIYQLKQQVHNDFYIKNQTLKFQICKEYKINIKDQNKKQIWEYCVQNQLKQSTYVLKYNVIFSYDKFLSQIHIYHDSKAEEFANTVNQYLNEYEVILQEEYQVENIQIPEEQLDDLYLHIISNENIFNEILQNYVQEHYQRLGIDITAYYIAINGLNIENKKIKFSIIQKKPEGVKGLIQQISFLKVAKDFKNEQNENINQYKNLLQEFFENLMIFTDKKSINFNMVMNLLNSDEYQLKNKVSHLFQNCNNIFVGLQEDIQTIIAMEQEFSKINDLNLKNIAKYKKQEQQGFQLVDNQIKLKPNLNQHKGKKYKIEENIDNKQQEDQDIIFISGESDIEDEHSSKIKQFQSEVNQKNKQQGSESSLDTENPKKKTKKKKKNKQKQISCFQSCKTSFMRKYNDVLSKQGESQIIIPDYISAKDLQLLKLIIQQNNLLPSVKAANYIQRGQVFVIKGSLNSVQDCQNIIKNVNDDYLNKLSSSVFIPQKSTRDINILQQSIKPKKIQQQNLNNSKNINLNQNDKSQNIENIKPSEEEQEDKELELINLQMQENKLIKQISRPQQLNKQEFQENVTFTQKIIYILIKKQFLQNQHIYKNQFKVQFEFQDNLDIMILKSESQTKIKVVKDIIQFEILNYQEKIVPKHDVTFKFQRHQIKALMGRNKISDAVLQVCSKYDTIITYQIVEKDKNVNIQQNQQQKQKKDEIKPKVTKDEETDTVMYYFEYKNDNNGFTAYTDAILQEIKKAQLEYDQNPQDKEKSTKEVVIVGKTYIIDFVKNVQINKNTKYERDIKKTPMQWYINRKGLYMTGKNYDPLSAKEQKKLYAIYTKYFTSYPKNSVKKEITLDDGKQYTVQFPDFSITDANQKKMEIKLLNPTNNAFINQNTITSALPQVQQKTELQIIKEYQEKLQKQLVSYQAFAESSSAANLEKTFEEIKTVLKSFYQYSKIKIPSQISTDYLNKLNYTVYEYKLVHKDFQLKNDTFKNADSKFLKTQEAIKVNRACDIDYNLQKEQHTNIKILKRGYTYVFIGIYYVIDKIISDFAIFGEDNVDVYDGNNPGFMSTGDYLTAGQVKFPPTWSPQKDNSQKFEIFSGNAEYNKVAASFNLTLGTRKITNIYRIQNKLLWQNYEIEKHKMIQVKKEILKKTISPNEQLLWHGTRGSAPTQIYQNNTGEGFDITYSNDACMWGKGVYFAKNAKYSNDYANSSAGKRIILCCLVALGECKHMASNSSLKKPPALEGGKCLYDSVSGNTNGSDVYILYQMHVRRGYPAYEVVYT